MAPMAQELWRDNPPRLLTDADVARQFDFSPSYVTKMRGKGWLPRRKAVAQGKAGGKGVARYAFLDVVAAEVARVSSAEFGWPESVLRQVVQVIQSNDPEQVKAAEVVVFRGEAWEGKAPKAPKKPEIPSTVRVVFFSPEEMAGDLGKAVEDAERDGDALNRTSLFEIVEAIGNKLYKQMKKAGIDFELGPTRKPRRKKRSN